MSKFPKPSVSSIFAFISASLLKYEVASTLVVNFASNFVDTIANWSSNAVAFLIPAGLNLGLRKVISFETAFISATTSLSVLFAISSI